MGNDWRGYCRIWRKNFIILRRDELLRRWFYLVIGIVKWCIWDRSIIWRKNGMLGIFEWMGRRLGGKGME